LKEIKFKTSHPLFYFLLGFRAAPPEQAIGCWEEQEGGTQNFIGNFQQRLMVSPTPEMAFPRAVTPFPGTGDDITRL
jgi:hypothetical protein